MVVAVRVQDPDGGDGGSSAVGGHRISIAVSERLDVRIESEDVGRVVAAFDLAQATVVGRPEACSVSARSSP
jgi:hypothetical protein